VSIGIAAFELAKIYLSFYKKYTVKTFRVTSIKKSTWKFFVTTIEKYKNDKDWNPYSFIASQFDYKGKIFPHELIAKDADYIYNSLRYKFENKESGMARGLLSGFNGLKNWCYKNNNRIIDIEKFLSNKNNIELIKNKQIDPLFFLFSKSFIHINQELKIFDDMYVNVNKTIIRRSKKITKKLKEILKNEYC
jgi:hypothetical protein